MAIDIYKYVSYPHPFKVPLNVTLPLVCYQFDSTSNSLVDRTGKGRNLTQGAAAPTYVQIPDTPLYGIKFTGNRTDILTYNTADSAVRILGEITIEVLASIWSVDVVSNFIATFVSHDATGDAEAQNYLYDLGYMDKDAAPSKTFRIFHEKGAGTDCVFHCYHADPINYVDKLTHYVLTRDGAGYYKFYINGELMTEHYSSNAGPPTGGGDGRLRIGDSANAANEACKATICGVRIITQELTGYEVYQIWKDLVEINKKTIYYNFTNLDKFNSKYLRSDTVNDIYYVDSTEENWRTHDNQFTGYDVEGYMYYKGNPTSVGAMTNATGDEINYQSWNTGTGDVTCPYVYDLAGNYNSFLVPVADGYDTINLNGVIPSGNTVRFKSIASLYRWYLEPGNFDIQVDFTFTLQDANSLIHLIVQCKSGGSFYMGRGYNGTAAPFDGYRSVMAGGAANTLDKVDATGKLRITLVGTSLQAYYWNAGWVALGAAQNGSSLGFGTLPVYVQIGAHKYSNAAIATFVATMSNFTINTGTVTTRTNWATETQSDIRSGRTFPNNAMLVSQDNALDIIDLDNDELWMRFAAYDNSINMLYRTAGNFPQVRKSVMKDGILLIAYGTNDTEAETGGCIFVDFTTGWTRLITKSANAYCGKIYYYYAYDSQYGFGSPYHPCGYSAIPYRNSSIRTLPGDSGANAIHVFYDSGNYTNWRVSDDRCWGVDLLHYNGYVIFAIGNVDGVSILCWRRWYFGNTTNIGEDQSAVSYTLFNTAVFVKDCLFDEDTADLYFMTSTKIYCVNYSNWWNTFAAHSFSLSKSIDLIGTISENSQIKMVRHEEYIYYPSDEGVWRININNFIEQELYITREDTKGVRYPIIHRPFTKITSIHKRTIDSNECLFISLENGTNDNHLIIFNFDNKTVIKDAENSRIRTVLVDNINDLG